MENNTNIDNLLDFIDTKLKEMIDEYENYNTSYYNFHAYVSSYSYILLQTIIEYFYKNKDNDILNLLDNDMSYTKELSNIFNHKFHNEMEFLYQNVASDEHEKVNNDYINKLLKEDDKYRFLIKEKNLNFLKSIYLSLIGIGQYSLSYDENMYDKSKKIIFNYTNILKRVMHKKYDCFFYELGNYYQKIHLV